MITMPMKMLVVLALGLVSGGRVSNELENGQSIVFTGIPYSCRYDLRPAMITGSGGGRVVSFDEAIVANDCGMAVRSKTPSFEVMRGDEALVVDVAYGIRHTPSTDTAVIRAIESR